jgi:hypothetical protein
VKGVVVELLDIVAQLDQELSAKVVLDEVTAQQMSQIQILLDLLHQELVHLLIQILQVHILLSLDFKVVIEVSPNLDLLAPRQVRVLLILKPLHDATDHVYNVDEHPSDNECQDRHVNPLRVRYWDDISKSHGH